MDKELLKRRAAEYAVSFVQSGMVVGLGEGSTAIWAIRRIAQLLGSGALQNVVGIPCSRNVERIARELGIPLATLEEHPEIDITIDGADEVDAQFNLIKGGGGALLREKIVAQASRREIIVIDASKRSLRLGTQWAVPIEVLPFGHGATQAFIESLGAQVAVRQTKNGGKYATDQGNLIFDSRFGPIENPIKLAEMLNARAGIVEHGLFIGLTSDLIVASEAGIEHLAGNRAHR